MQIKLPKFFRRLDKFILCIAVSTGIVVAGVSAYLLSNFGNRIIKYESDTTAEYISKQTFNTMFQIMKKGWNEKQVIAFMNALKKSSKNENMVKTYIFRGAIVDRQFGKIPQPKENFIVKKVFKTKRPFHAAVNGNIVYAYPLKAQKMCLKCHTIAKIGDVNGVIEVSYSPSLLRSKLEGYFILIIFLIFILPLWQCTRYLFRLFLPYTSYCPPIKIGLCRLRRN